MARHVADDFTFDLPDDWSISTVISAPVHKDDAFTSNLVITRDRLRPNETMQTYIDRQIVDLAKKLKRFVLRGRREVVVGGVTSYELSCSWQGAQGPVEQRLTVVPRARDDGTPGVITFTGSAGKNRTAEAVAVFDALLGTLSFEVSPSDEKPGEADDHPGV